MHPTFGALIEPYVVDLTRNGDLSLTFRRVTTNTITEYDMELQPVDMELISIVDNYLEDNLVKHFCKDNIKPKDFFKTLSESELSTVVKPYVEKTLTKAFDVLYKNNIPLYFKGQKKDAIIEKPLEIVRDPAEVIFNFIRGRESTKYFLNIRHNGRSISLAYREAIFLTHKPCRLLIGSKIYRFTDEIDSKKLMPFFSKTHIDIPRRSEQKYFETFILNSIKNFRVDTEGFDVSEIHPEVKAVLKLENNWAGGPMLVLCFKYGERSFFLQDKSKSAVFLEVLPDNFSFINVIRNHEAEERLLQLIMETGLYNREGSLFVPPGYSDLPDYQSKKHYLYGWINAQSEFFAHHGIELLQDESNERFFTGKIYLDLKIENRKDWFDIYGVVRFGAFELPFTSLRNHILGGKREYVLPNGEIAIIPEEWFTKYQSILRFSEKQMERLKLKKHHFILLEGLNPQKEIGVKPLHEIIDFRKIKPYPVPEVNAILRPYQKEGFRWMNFLQENNLGGCLADDMGLGKTVQTLTLLLKFKNDKVLIEKEPEQGTPMQLSLFDNILAQPRPSRTSLLVMPLSLIHNWENEIRKFAPQLRAFKHTGINRIEYSAVFKEYDVILTTYGVVRKDIDMLKQFQFFYIILDESQAIKNPDSKIFRSICEINAKHRLVLTGTPIENSLTDLWSQMTFVNDGLLGSLSFFKDYFVTPIEKQRDETKQDELRKLIEPFILRRTKKVVAQDLPPVSTKIYYCEMTEEQQKIYDAHKSAIRNTILENIEKQGREKTNFVILSGLMKLRLIANHPALVEKETLTESGKFIEVINCIEKLMSENHKVLIFSSFVKHLDVFKQHFEKSNIRYSLLTGSSSDTKRKEIIEEFQNDTDIRIFLISLKAGGVGLNLTSADYVFILDPWWNPAAESQAINRTHRIGQDKNIFAYKFISRGSIEEKILKLQEDKMLLANDFVNNNNPFKDFSNEDIKKLFE